MHASYVLFARCARAALVSLTAAACIAACAVESADDDVDGESAELRVEPKVALKTLRSTVSKSQLQPAQIAFASHADYIAANIALAPIGALRSQVETAVGGSIKNRGEAHITTITPIEMGVLTKKLAASQIERIAIDNGVQKANVVPKCIGLGSKGADSTFYLVVESPDLLAVRRAIAAAYVAKGGAASAFNAEKFFPHATIGFTKRDLFESDGVIKSVASCPNPTGIGVLP
jgi:hypothetical protein